MSNVCWYTWIKTCVQQHTAAMPIMQLATNCQFVISTSPRHLCTRLTDVTHLCMNRSYHLRPDSEKVETRICL